jgi:hypothetical protein
MTWCYDAVVLEICCPIKLKEKTEGCAQMTFLLIIQASGFFPEFSWYRM